VKSSSTHTRHSVASHNCYTTCPGICIYQEECYCQIAQGMRLSNTEHLSVTCPLHAENNQLETCMFFEKWYGFNFLSRSRSVSIIWDSPSSHVMSCEHHDWCCAAAVMASSLVDVCAVWMHLVW